MWFGNRPCGFHMLDGRIYGQPLCFMQVTNGQRGRPGYTHFAMQKDPLSTVYMVIDELKDRRDDIEGQGRPVRDFKLEMMLYSANQVNRRQTQYSHYPLFFKRMEIKRIA
jgi:hypothetical protein